MSAYLEIINDAAAASSARLNALERYAAERAVMPAFTGEINNHIHTIFSFSPYTPAMAALKAREAGLEAAGSVDHDSYSAAEEMRRACAILGIGCVTGFELRVSFRHTEFGNKKINSPDSPGIAYMTVQGVPSDAAERIEAFLAPLSAARHKRNRRMTGRLNTLLAEAGLGELSYDDDILPLSMAARGGSLTERHILYALSLLLIKQQGRGLLDLLLQKFSLNLPEKIAALLEDAENPYYAWDLLGALKSSFSDKIFIQPGEDECLPAETVTAFARSINAVPSYAYLGDVAESPTGDKKAEKFEDGYLETLFPCLKDMGFRGITYMPPRNTAEQLARLRSLCEQHGFIEISGVDINSPRQSFTCPEIRRPEFAVLRDTTWALAAHEHLSSGDATRGLFNPADPLAEKPLGERIETFAAIGRGMRKCEK
jgi:predicted metal-dependent phosphoesterase TrpH